MTVDEAYEYAIRYSTKVERVHLCDLERDMRIEGYTASDIKLVTRWFMIALNGSENE